MPGSPLDGLILRYGDQIRANPDFIKTLQVMYPSAKEPIWKAYPAYWERLLHGDLGQSFALNVPVTQVLRNTVPWSFFLVATGFLLAFAIGTGLGMIAAWRRNGIVDTICTPFLMALQSFPQFFVALLFAYVLGLQLGWFPFTHATDYSTTIGFTWTFIEDAMRHAVLPIGVIVVGGAGGWLLGMRNVMITTVEEDYILLAHAKGLRGSRVMTRYAARNAILPPLTALAPLLGAAVGGLIVIEYVFSYPGVGFALQQAALGHDYALAQGFLLLISFFVLFANFAMDCLYVLLDPRVRAS
jgi:peptide/nickel transport system permease protein